MTENTAATANRTVNQVSCPPSFTITNRHGKARTGYLHTNHGIVETPAFIFCATKAAIKCVTADQLRLHETQIILSNTYHLMLQPGSSLVKEMGGLQQFTNWNGPMLTDSGGFQIFSLGHGSVADEIKGRRTRRHQTLVKLDEDGATFKSYINGQTHRLTPEGSINIQQELGADLIVVLDECTPFHVDKTYTKDSTQRSHRWAKRCLDFFNDTNDGSQALYGIVQGGVYQDLRHASCAFVNDHDFFGHAIGGSLGADKQQMHDIVACAMEQLSPQRPTHLLGIGGLSDIINGVNCGVDTFDCVHPTRLARHGSALTYPIDAHSSLHQGKSSFSKEHINLKNACFAHDKTPIDDQCLCETCRGYSKAYIHHLLRAKELLAYTLLSIHNIYFMNRFMRAIRHCINNNQILSFDTIRAGGDKGTSPI